MRRFIPLLLASLWLVPAVHAAPPSADAPKAVSCVSVRAEARPWAQAFNHIVHLDNGCDHAVSCIVATNVNPEPQSVTLECGKKTEVLTFRGSPARVFTPKVSCTKR